MNFYAIIYFLGWICVICGGCLTFPAFVGMYYHESQWFTYAVVAVIAIAVGLITVRKKPKVKGFYAKEGFVTVAVAWLLMSLVGALPFYIAKDIPNYLDAVFETASGFTTTGASILTNVEALSHPALFWRSFTHWIGGMGVLVFILAIVPTSDGGAMQLMKAESPGPSVGKIVPKIRETALILYILYTVMTIVEAILLLFGGMPWFDAITTALATAGTGGFSVRGTSMAFYDNYYLQGVVTVFMILFGVNFSIYYLALNKKFKSILKSEEMWTYLGIIGISILVITINTVKSNFNGELFPAFHHSAFSVASVISTTGFGTEDFNLWPQLSKYILFVLMFIGASAGSTGGGMKVSRLIILFKSGIAEISNIVHPRTVKRVQMDGKKIDRDVLRQTKSFFILSMIVFVVSALIVSIDNKDMTTTITSVAATMNNIGPGLELVGPTGNYSMFSWYSKIVLIFDMLAGRLEYFPMLILFSPVTWKGTGSAIKRRILWKKRKM